jgi:hypothetical protein
LASRKQWLNLNLRTHLNLPTHQPLDKINLWTYQPQKGQQILLPLTLQSSPEARRLSPSSRLPLPTDCLQSQRPSIRSSLQPSIRFRLLYYCSRVPYRTRWALNHTPNIHRHYNNTALGEHPIIFFVEFNQQSRYSRFISHSLSDNWTPSCWTIHPILLTGKSSNAPPKHSPISRSFAHFLSIFGPFFQLFRYLRSFNFGHPKCLC